MEDLERRDIDANLLTAALFNSLGIDWLADVAVVEVPVGLIRALHDDIAENNDGCDHSVGICACEVNGVQATLGLWLDGKTWCPACGGDGFDLIPITGSDLERGEWEDCAAVPCPTCAGQGAVDLEVVA